MRDAGKGKGQWAKGKVDVTFSIRRPALLRVTRYASRATT
jgi:hypothetical protein